MLFVVHCTSSVAEMFLTKQGAHTGHAYSMIGDQ